MSSYIQNLFSFARDLPAPYDQLSGKKVSVSSQYGDGTEATLSASFIKAIHAVCKCKEGGEGAVGTLDNKCIAEYKSSNSPDEYHLAVYSVDTGLIIVSVYDKNTENVESYTMNSSGRDGAAVFMAMFPALMQDVEFREKFNEYFTEYQGGLTDLNKATNIMGILADNAYRRLKDENCAMHLKSNIERSGNMMRVSSTQIDSGTFEPKSVVAGTFTIFAQSGATGTIAKAEIIVEAKDFVGKYEFGQRTFSAEEQKLIPKLPEWYIIPEEVVDICKHAKLTTGKPTQMRNFLLRGPAGTGKTMGAKAIAAGLNLPYVKYTCSAGTEIFDFVGQILPDSSKNTSGATDKELAKIEDMGGITFENVAKLMGLPDLADMDYDPAGTYQALTGVEKQDATSQDCMAVVMEKTIAKVQALNAKKEQPSSTGQTFSYTDTDFLRALKKGYVVELQERAIRS